MFLKTLEIQGFKSFPDRVKIEIGKGLTAVVGPNGSGKSNVSDAIRWVLGEQSAKSLRGGKMEDVIFGGTQKRRPMGYAEVSLTIDNSQHRFDMDAEEIRVTRKYYRSGESDYLINGQSVRLRDIHELFMDTGLGRDGYSMIGQGKVDEIVNAKPLERRYIFEEAAGIAKYRHRREEAIRKLDQAEDNLSRLRDILAEKESRLEPLRIQSEKAAKFLELDRKKRGLEISLWVYKLEKLKQDLREQENKIFAVKNEYTDCVGKVEENEEKIRQIYTRMEEILTEADRLREEKSVKESELAEFKSSLAVLSNDISHKEEEIRRLDREMETIRMGGDERKKQVEDYKTEEKIFATRIEAKEKEQAGLEEALSHLNLENSDASDRLTELTREINRLTGEQSNARVLLASFSTTKEELTARLARIEEEKNLLESQKGDLNRRIQETGNLLSLLEEQEKINENQQAGVKTVLAKREEKLAELTAAWEKQNQEIAKAEHRASILRDMEKNMEGFAYSVKYVLRQVQNGLLGGIEGPVFRLIKAKEGYEVAVETALGGALQNIICRTEEDAKEAIRALKKGDGGRATFLPMETVKGQKADVSAVRNLPGFLGLASEAVEYAGKYDGIVLALLGRVLLAEDLDAATELAKKLSYRYRVVTKDGQVVNAGGSLTGGSNAKNNGLISRSAEIEKMEKKAKAQREALEQEKGKAKPLQGEIEKMQASLTALKAEAATLREDRAAALAEAAALTREEQAEKEKAEALLREENDHKRRLSGLESSREMSEKTEKETTARIAKLEEESDKLTGDRTELKNRRSKLFEDVNACRLAVIELKKDAERVNLLRLRLEAQDADDEVKNASVLAEQNRVREELAALQAKQAEGGGGEKQFRDEIDRLDEAIAAKLSARLEVDGQVSLLQKEGKEYQERKDNLTREQVRLEERRNAMENESSRLIDGLMDEYEITLTEATAEAEVLESPEKTQKEVGSLKWQIRQLGSVNPAAIEEYKEVKESHAFLSSQVKDLEESKAQLLGLIDELGATMKNLFSVEFGRINSNFSKIFHNLFGGGEAELTFTDPADVLNSGIEIKAQPPGKLIRSLTSLSGGERAMVAVSIYFAILTVRPAPFCVLDEVDAPLDDVNVNRLTDYLKLLGNKTQFISITHKRGTMEAADILYGVTMQEKGVTKVLGLDVAGAMAHLEKTTK